MYFCCCCYILFLAFFLLNDAADDHVDILIFVSVGHVVENARLVDVDGGAMVACGQAVSFVVMHGRLFSHQHPCCGEKCSW